MNSGAAVIRRQQRGSEEVWVEVLEMSSASVRRRRQGDKCPLFVQLPDRQTWSRCLLTRKRLSGKSLLPRVNLCAFVYAGTY